MTTRERRERRAERREAWAESRRQKSRAAFGKASEIADQIPLGQPILVGHHSERRARRDQERITRGMAAGVEHDRMAARHQEAADNIRKGLDRAIYRDDPDAVERLEERLGDLEARRDRIKAINDWFRKNRKAHGLSGRYVDVTDTDAENARRVAACLTAATAALGITADERRTLLDALQFNRSLGFPPYALSNLNGNIRRARQRLDEAVAARSAAEDTDADDV